jgi:hypothetical protein
MAIFSPIPYAKDRTATESPHNFEPQQWLGAVRYVEIAVEESVLARPLDRNVEAGRAPTRVGAHENLGFAKHEEKKYW